MKLSFVATALAAVTVLSGCQTVKSVTTEIWGQSSESVEQPLIHDLSGFRHSSYQEEGGDDAEHLVGIAKDFRQRLQDENQNHYSLKKDENLLLLKNNDFDSTGKGAEKLQRYIERIIDRLLARWPHQRPDITVSIVENDDYNAELSPAHDLRINIGYFTRAEHEGQIAALVAHEISHALLNHVSAQRWSELESSFTEVGATVLALHLANKTSDDKKKGVGSAIALNGTEFDRLHKIFFGSSRSRVEEDHADMLAVDLLYRAGYDIWSVETFLEGLEERDEMFSQQRKAERQETARNLEAEQARAHPTTPNGIPKIPPLKYLLAKAKNSGLDALEDWAGDDHAKSSSRLENIKTYINRFYADQDDGEIDPPRFHHLKNDPDVTILFAKAKNSWTAYDQVQNGEWAGAEKLILAALEGRKDTHPVLRGLLYKVRKHQGKDKTALLNLEIAMKGDQVTNGVYQMAIDELSRTKKTDKAVKVINTRKDKLNIDGEFYFQDLIRVNWQGGRRAEAKKVAETCQAMLKINRCHKHLAALHMRDMGAVPNEFTNEMTLPKNWQQQFINNPRQHNPFLAILPNQLNSNTNNRTGG